MPVDQTKLRENRLRRRARRLGLLLVKSRTRDRFADDYGTYVLAADCAGNRHGRYGGQEAVSAFAKGQGTDLDGIENELRLLADQRCY